MEYLKALFGEEVLTYDQFAEKPVEAGRRATIFGRDADVFLLDKWVDDDYT